MSADERAAIRRASIGYIFQDLNLMPSLTALENVSLVRELDGQHPRQAARQARDALDKVGITELADRLLSHMSGGQQQRVAIARALVGCRRIILGDELTGSLDSVTSMEVVGLLRDVVTQDAGCAAWADRIITLRDGQITGSASSHGVESLLDGLA